MRKFFTTVIALTMLTAGISGCTNNDNSGSSGSSDVSDSSDNSDNSDSSNSDNSDNSDSSDLIGTPDASGSTSDSTSDGTSQGGENLPDPNGRAAKLGAAAMAAVEWPSMMDVTDAETATMFFNIDLNMCEDYYFSNQLISAQLNEILVAKPTAGNEDALKDAFDAHFEYIQNEAALYPDQEASAAGAVSGTTEDGYLYIIVHENGAEVAEAMLAAE